MLGIRDEIKDLVSYEIGSGQKISMWYDKWCPNGPLCDVISKTTMYEARVKDIINVAEMISNGEWLWPDGCNEGNKLLANRLGTLNNMKDRVNALASNRGKNIIGVIMNKMLLAATVYFLWKTKNVIHMASK
ncbi:hypothetical protein Tco_1578122 [Tanacetum coccineum]